MNCTLVATRKVRRFRHFFVAFSEYMNFKNIKLTCALLESKGGGFFLAAGPGLFLLLGFPCFLLAVVAAIFDGAGEESVKVS
jgi:hypothetical protein